MTKTLLSITLLWVILFGLEVRPQTKDLPDDVPHIVPLPERLSTWPNRLNRYQPLIVPDVQSLPERLSTWPNRISRPQPLITSDFSGGLNTNTNWFQVKMDESSECRNFLLDQPIGALTVRNGYTVVSDSLPDHTRIWSVNSYRFPNGKAFLFQTVWNFTWDGCDLYVSDAYDYNLGTLLHRRIYPARGQWVNWLERQYFFTGRHNPLVVAGGSENFYIQEMPLPAPGQLSVRPLASSGTLNGEYLWTYVVNVPCSTSVWATRTAPLSRKIKCVNEVAIIHNFVGWVTDSLQNAGASGCNDTTVDVMLLRTRADCFDPTDTLFRVRQFSFYQSQSPCSCEWVDNMPDANLTDTNAWRTIGDTAAWSGCWTVACNSDMEWFWALPGPNSAYAPASPSYTYTDTGVVAGDTVNISIDSARRSGQFPVQWQIYHVYYLDTTTGASGDTSRAVFFGETGSVIHRTRTISLPPTPSGRWARVLVRTDYDAYVYPNTQRPPDPNTLTRYVLDTIFDSSQTEYLDHLEPPTIVTDKPAWMRRIMDELLKGAIIHEGRMFAWDDFRVWPSISDTPGVFSVLNNVEFDLDDGDIIVGCKSFHGYILVYKTNSMWILYTSDGEIYNRVKASRGIGCASYRTIVPYAGTHFVLGQNGVFAEVENPRRSEAVDRPYISNQIENILVRPLSTMRDAFGTVIDHRYFLSYPGTDSVFVYFAKTGGWSLFTGIDIWDGVFYDTTANIEEQNFDQFWFVVNDDERLYVWNPDATTDDGDSILAVWGKHHFAPSLVDQQMLSHVYLVWESNGLVTDSIRFYLEDENGNQFDTVTAPGIWGSAGSMYEKMPVAANGNRVFHDLSVRCVVDGGLTTKIYGLGFDVRNAKEGE